MGLWQSQPGAILCRYKMKPRQALLTIKETEGQEFQNKTALTET